MSNTPITDAAAYDSRDGRRTPAGNVVDVYTCRRLEEELRLIKSGELVVLPVSDAHANILAGVAANYLDRNRKRCSRCGALVDAHGCVETPPSKGVAMCPQCGAGD